MIPPRADLLAKIIETTETINGFVLVARRSGYPLECGARRGPRGEASWRNTPRTAKATSVLPPERFRRPSRRFFPVSHTSGPGHQFARRNGVRQHRQQAFSNAQGGFAAAGDRSPNPGQRGGQGGRNCHRIESQMRMEIRRHRSDSGAAEEISIGAAMESLIGSPVGSPGSLSFGGPGDHDRGA